MITWLKKFLGGASVEPLVPEVRPVNAPDSVTEYQLWLIASIVQQGFAFIAEHGRGEFPPGGYPVVDRGEQSVLRKLEKLDLVERKGARYFLTEAGQWVYENQDDMKIRRSY